MFSAKLLFLKKNMFCGFLFVFLTLRFHVGDEVHLRPLAPPRNGALIYN